ncbi:MAG: class I SAM-dependent methyltransferase, partial [Actinomycetota bacterium]
MAASIGIHRGAGSGAVSEAEAASGDRSVREPVDAPTGAAAYDRWFESLWGRYAAAIEWDTLLGALGPVDDDLVLDAGCGTGRFSVELARAGAHVVGLDIDMDMLVLATKRLAGPVVAGDIERLPVRDGVFDVAAAVT